MIVSEHSIRSIVDAIPSVRINNDTDSSPFFHWGDRNELNRYLQEKDKPYPLIWLLPTPDDYIDRGRSLNKKCEFIIATLERREDLYNDQRYINSFDVILNPTVNYLIQGLKKSSTTNMIGEFTINKFPNYSEAGKNVTIALWDAITLTIDVNFNSNCLKPILYT